ncbi:MAG: hypothetical protein KY438_11580, partial [Actinobacteria bacterium]|nr:hypothetical protein [Actinomycetota bacterium]
LLPLVAGKVEDDRADPAVSLQAAREQAWASYEEAATSKYGAVPMAPIAAAHAVVSALPAGTFVLDGGLHPDEVADITGLEVPEGPYETLAGFLLDRLGHLPEAGEQVEYEGWCLEVLEMDRRRIASVRLVAPAGDDQGEHS